MSRPSVFFILPGLFFFSASLFLFEDFFLGFLEDRHGELPFDMASNDETRAVLEAPLGGTNQETTDWRGPISWVMRLMTSTYCTNSVFWSLSFFWIGLQGWRWLEQNGYHPGSMISFWIFNASRHGTLPKRTLWKRRNCCLEHSKAETCRSYRSYRSLFLGLAPNGRLHRVGSSHF